LIAGPGSAVDNHSMHEVAALLERDGAGDCVAYRHLRREGGSSAGFIRIGSY